MANMNVDWAGLQTKFEEFISTNSSELLGQAITTTSSIIGGIITLVLSLVFAVYIL